MIGIDVGIRTANRQTLAYRGPDRRRASTAQAPKSHALVIALGLLVTVTAVIGVAAVSAAGRPDSAHPATSEWLAATTVALAALAGAVSTMRWRLVGEAGSLWVGAALFVYSALSVGLARLVTALPSGGALGWWALVMRPASVFVVIVLLVTAFTAPAVDGRLRPRRVIVASGVAFAVGVLLASLSSPFRTVLGPALDQAPASGFGGQAGVSLLWLSLGVAFVYRSLRRSHLTGAWVGIMLLALAESRMALGLSVTSDGSWIVASQLFRAIGIAAALFGGIRELQAAFVEQRAHLLDSLLELGSSEARRRAERASEAERAHDVRAALAGIGGATLTLERYSDRLSTEERSELASAVVAEIARLQDIVARARHDPAPFSIADAVRSPVVCARSRGLAVDLHIPCDLTGFGRPAEFSEVLQNLLDNAASHAPGASVTIQAEAACGMVVVTVADRGPGIAPADRDRVFARGWTTGRGNDRAGLGLFVSRRLLRDQGGDLHLEHRPGWGAVFAMTIPSTAEDVDDAG